jgi:DNA-binding NtrC family response regulator
MNSIDFRKRRTGRDDINSRPADRGLSVSTIRNTWGVTLLNKNYHGSLLVVDDDRAIRESMADYLRSLGHRTETAGNCVEAIQRMREYPFHIVLCDVNLPDADGFHLLEWAVENTPEIDVILITGYGTIESAVEAMRIGAFEYLTKPVIDQELHLAIQRALSKRQIVDENRNLKAQLNQRFGMANIIGRDYRMLRLFDLIESVADTKTTVLILGESGTGKTMTARAIHQFSSRRSKPFVEVSCGALPDTLLESELFGHVAGAFTGATHDKVGKAGAAGEAASRPPGSRVRAGRRHQDAQSRRPHGPRHESEPR